MEAARVPPIVADLSRARAFPAPSPDSVEVIETHASWVFLDARRVFKVKKPVRFEFLDFSTPERRRRACEAEVALNSRLAPGVYRGVVAVRRASDGRLAFGGSGEAEDWAVEMLRLPDEHRLDVMLSRGAVDVATIDAVADRIADFHARSRSDEAIARYGDPALVAEHVAGCFGPIRAVASKRLVRRARSLEREMADRLRAQRAAFAARATRGAVREGHGDLRLEHVYVDERGAITVLDCVEFDVAYRAGDVAADVGFLAMELALEHRSDLAEHLLARYARAANDFDLFGVVDFYVAYRALVRAKVAAIRAASSSAPGPMRRALRRHLALAIVSMRKRRARPKLFAIGGLIASGKSTMAEAIARAVRAPIVDSDRTRKSMLGKRPLDPVRAAAWDGEYAPAFTERVYDELLRRAEVVLSSGRSVVLDASFRSEALRARVRALASRAGADLVNVECRAPDEVLRARLRERDRHASVSDGRAELLDAFRSHYEIDSSALVLDTTRPVAENVALVLAATPASRS